MAKKPASKRSIRDMFPWRREFLFVQLALPEYRRLFIDQLLSEIPRLRIFAGPHHFESSVTSADIWQERVLQVPTYFILGRRFAFQLLPITALLSSRGYIIEGNPRILSTWLIAVMARLLNRPCGVLAHLQGRSGRKIGAGRRLLFHLASDLIVYTQAEKVLGEQLWPKRSIIAFGNGLYSKESMKTATSPKRDAFLVIGRLTADKRPELAIEAFLASRTLCRSAYMLVIGDGAEREALEGLVRERALEDRILFLGWVTEEEELRAHFSRALALVSPGYAGLNAIQSIGFGIPVIFSPGEPNAPEALSLTAKNSVQFVAGSSGSLAVAMEAVLRDANSWQLAGDAIAESARDSHSVEHMTLAIRRVLEKR